MENEKKDRLQEECGVETFLEVVQDRSRRVSNNRLSNKVRTSPLTYVYCALELRFLPSRIRIRRLFRQ